MTPAEIRAKAEELADPCIMLSCDGPGGKRVCETCDLAARIEAALLSARAEALREGWRKAMEKASGVAVNAAITGVIGETEGEASGRGKTALRLSHGFDYLATNQEPADE